MDELEQSGMLLVISGPSGVGKDTVWKIASECLPSFSKAVTCTTRSRRPGEQHGVNYYFVTNEEFDRLIADDQLLEWALVHGARYGVPQASVLGPLNDGLDVVCVIDVQGAQRIRSLFPWALLVFLTPPAGRETDVLIERMEGRGTGADEVQKRVQAALSELTHMPLYDHQIVNEDAATAAAELCRLVEQEKGTRLQASSVLKPAPSPLQDPFVPAPPARRG